MSIALRTRAAARGGSAVTALLLVLLILIAILGLALVLRTGGPPADRGEAEPRPAVPVEERVPVEPRAAAPAPVPGATGPDSAPAVRAAGEARTAAPDPTPAGADATRFAGRGRLRGSIAPTGGAEMPATWTLVVRPNPMVPGHEHAVRREVEHTADEREFVVEDLPLGGYEVTARAPGRNCRGVPVLLDRTHRDGYVTLQLTPAGFLEGLVRDEGGEPLDGLAVRLELVHTASGAGGDRETRTDVNGAFRFDDVLDGSYRLHFGSGEPPVLPPRSLVFGAPSMRFPPVVAPRLARLELLVLAEGGGPIAGAEAFVEGPTGRVELVTDAAGRAVAHLLRPGPHRLTVQAEGFAPIVRDLSLAGDERVEERVELRRP